MEDWKDQLIAQGCKIDEKGDRTEITCPANAAKKIRSISVPSELKIESVEHEGTLMFILKKK